MDETQAIYRHALHRALRLTSEEELAARLRVSRRRLRSWIDGGDVPGSAFLAMVDLLTMFEITRPGEDRPSL